MSDRGKQRVREKNRRAEEPCPPITAHEIEVAAKAWRCDTSMRDAAVADLEAARAALRAAVAARETELQRAKAAHAALGSMVAGLAGTLGSVPIAAATEAAHQAASRAAVSDLVAEADRGGDIAATLASVHADMVAGEERQSALRGEREALLSSVPGEAMAEVRVAVDAMVSGGKDLEAAAEGASPAGVEFVLRPLWEIVRQERATASELGRVRPRVAALRELDERGTLRGGAMVGGLLAAGLRSAVCV